MSDVLVTKIKLQIHQTVITVKSLTFLKCPVFLVAMLHLLVRAIAAINQFAQSHLDFSFLYSSNAGMIATKTMAINIKLTE